MYICACWTAECHLKIILLEAIATERLLIPASLTGCQAGVLDKATQGSGTMLAVAQDFDIAKVVKLLGDGVCLVIGFEELPSKIPWTIMTWYYEEFHNLQYHLSMKWHEYGCLRFQNTWVNLIVQRVLRCKSILFPAKKLKSNNCKILLLKHEYMELEFVSRFDRFIRDNTDKQRLAITPPPLWESTIKGSFYSMW